MDREELLELLQYDKCFALIDAAKVRRWHTKPALPIQETGNHTFNMLLILIALHPNPSANLMQAVIRHDLAERIGSDFPHEMKKQFPVLKEIDDIMQEQFNEAFELPELKLTPQEKIWLSLLDQLEPCMFIEYNIPDPTEESMSIFDNCLSLVSESVEKLKDFGFFVESENHNLQ